MQPTAREERPIGPTAALSLLRQRNFGTYFVGNSLSAMGTWFQQLAAGLLIYRETNSEFLLGVYAFAQFLPTILLAPWAGAAADRFDRRKLLLWWQGAFISQAAALAVLAWLDLASPAVVIAFGVAFGVGVGYTLPAGLALVGSLVERHELPSAVGLNSITYNLSRVVGPGLAALTIAGLGIPASFTINAASYLASFVGLYLCRPRPQERPVSAKLSESLRLVRADPVLLALLVVVAVAATATDPINTLAPAFAEAFGRPDTWAGVVIGVFGAGAVVAGIFVSGRVAGSRSRLAGTLAVLSLGVCLFSVIPWFPLALVLLFFGGAGYLASNTSATAQLQLRVAEGQRGRIMALWGVAFVGTRPLAGLIDGAIASAIGVEVAGVVLAAPAGLLAIAIVWTTRRARRA